MPSYNDYVAMLQQPAQSAPKGEVPQDLVDAIMGVESGGDPGAVSSQGARGRMQIMPATYAQYGDGTPFESASDDQLFRAALAKLNDDYRHYNGDVRKTSAAYLGGRGAVLADGTIRADVKDANGTSPLAYADMIEGRLKGEPKAALPQQEAPNPDEVLTQFKAKYLPAQPTTQSGSIPGDIGRLLKIGTNQAASDVRELVGRVPVIGKPIQRGIDWLDEAIQGRTSEEILKSDTKEMQAGLTPETKAAMEKKWWDEDKHTFGDAWKDPRAYWTGAVQSLPETALMMFPSLRIAKGTYAANLTKAVADGTYTTLVGEEVAKGVAREIAEATAKKALIKTAAAQASRAAALTGSITEGLLGGAQASTQTRDEILAMPDEKLQQSDAIKSLMAGGMSFAEAKRAVAEDASTKAFLVAGVADGIFGGMGDRLLANAITTGLGGNIVTRIVKGAMAEGLLEEAPQSYLEKVATNLGLQTVDPTIPTTQGAINEMIGGGIAGGLMGGGMAAPFAEHDTALPPSPKAEEEPAPASTTFEQIKQKRIEYLQGQMDLLRKEAGVDQNNGDIYATGLGEQYQWLEAKLQQELQSAPAVEQPEAPAPEPEPDVQEPMRPFTERAMIGYSTEERAQKVAESMSKVQNGQYAVMPHPRLPGKFAVVPAEWAAPMPERNAPRAPLSQEEISARLAQAAAQAPDNSLEAQMQRAEADRALQAIEARQGVASPMEAQVVEAAGLGRPYDRIDPSLAPSEQQTTPRSHEVTTDPAEARAVELDQLDQAARGTPAPVQNEVDLANQRLEAAAQQAEPGRMDPTELALRDANAERETTAAPSTTPAGVILPDSVERPETKQIPFSQPPAPVTIAGKVVKDLSLGELQTFSKSKQPDVAAKAKAELDFRATPAGANERVIRQVTSNPEFKQWFAKSRVVDSRGVPLMLYHGTTADFDVFDATNGNVRGDFGAGFYFTNSPKDVAANYAGLGPDLTAKIDETAQQIAGETGREYDDPEVMEEARARYMQHEGAVMPVFLRMENPVKLGGKDETFFDYTEDFNEKNDSYDEFGGLVDFIVALRNVASRYEGGNVESVVASLLDRASGDGVTASDLVEIVKSDDNFFNYTDDEGNPVGAEILRAAFEESGYDGIIDKTVNRKFGTDQKFGKPMKGVGRRTTHYIAFRPDQIKSATGNRGTFDPNDASIVNEQAPAGSSLPFGRGWQLHREVPVTRNAPMLPAVEQRTVPHPVADRFPNVFDRISPVMNQQINDAITDLKSLGLPDAALWGIRGFATHTEALAGPTVRGRSSTHFTNSGEPIRLISLMRSMLEQDGKDQTVPYQARGVLLHEIAHLNDFQNGQGYLTHTSPLFDVELSGNGELVPVGGVMQEALDAYLNDFDGQGPIADLLHYPFSTFREAGKNPDGINYYKSETFAQLHTLYYLMPTLMQERMPTAFRLFEEIKHATEALGPENSGTDSARKAPRDLASSRREEALGRAVQGAFRRVSESAGSVRSGRQPNARIGSRGGQVRQGRPYAVAAQNLEGGSDGAGLDLGSKQLAGSNFGSDVGHPRSKKDGRYIGAPRTVTSPQTLAVMRQRIEQLAQEGANGRMWYERSGKAILDLAEGNKDLAEKIVGLFAIYSPSTQVASNTTVALKAYYEWADGKPITSANVQGHIAAEHAQAWMDGTADEKLVSGVKRSNFYKNLMREIDPVRLGADAQGVTVDMWMARALGYLNTQIAPPSKTGEVPPQYGFAEKEIKRIGQRLGWEPQQAQAAIWVAVKSRFDNIYNDVRDHAVAQGWLKRVVKQNRYGKPTTAFKPANEAGRIAFESMLLQRAMDQGAQDITKASYDFADAVAERTAQISWEAKPGETTGVLPGIFKAPLAQQAEYLDAVDRALRDENGQDEIAKMVGLGGSHTIFGPSAWKLDVGAGAQTEAAVATDRVSQSEVSIHEPARDVFNLYSAIRGYILDQEAVAWHYPVFDTSLKRANGIEMRIERALSHQEVKALYEEISRRAEHTEFAPIYTPKGFRVLNFTDMPNGQFHRLVEDAYHAVKGLPNANFHLFRSEGDYIFNDYKENPHGQGYLERIASAGRSDLQGRIDGLKRRVVEVNRDFSRRYGWGTASLQEGDIAGSNEQANLAEGLGRGNVPSVSGSTPKVAIRQRQEDAQEVTGIHYSRQELSELDGSRYGTGIKGAEAQRLQYDPSIAPRVYFYLQPDNEVLHRPEPGLGPNVHRAILTNMYPFATDPAKVFPAIRNIMDPDERGNEMERRITAAGYDGYFNKNLGMAVILGKGPVPVEYLGKHDGQGGLRDIAGSNFAVPSDTSDETMTELVRSQMAMNGIDGNADLFPLGHARRVALYATELGRAAGLTDGELAVLSSAAMLHDIGKVTLPEPVLNKEGTLNDVERKIIEQHTTAAETLLADQLPVIREAAAQHHERWDGAGYPKGLKGDEISKFARILAVADVFDALTSDRSYKKGWTKDAAIKLLYDWSGTHFEPGLVDKFADIAASNEAAMPEWLAGMPQADQDAAKKAGIYLPQRTWKDRLQGLRNGWKERVTQGMFDQFAPIKQLDEHAYVLDRMTKGADAGLEALLMYGRPVLNSAGALDVADLDKGGIIQLFSELNGEHDRFLGWIAGQRAALLKQQGRENNLTNTDISALRNWNAGQMADGRNRAAVYADVHRRFQTFNKAVLDIAEKAGLIDGAERKNWEQDFYVPFYRVLEQQGYDGPRDIGGLVNQYAFKRLRGGKEKLNDLFENTIRNWGHLIGASLKNQAAQASIAAAERAGVAVEVPGREKGAVSFRDQGKQRWFMVEDPLILDAITSLEYAGISGGPVMKAFQKAKHYLTFGVTMAPAFKIRNLVRDQLSAVALNPVSGNVMGNLAQGWKLTSKDEAQYAHMLAGGGLMRFGTSLEGSRSEYVDRLVKMTVDDKTTITTAQKAKDVLERMWNAWQELGDRSENVTRATVYRQAYDRAIKAGKSADEAHLIASYTARDSMDFALQGAFPAVRLLSQLVPFFNARLQGLYKIGREGVAPTIRMLTGNAKAGDAAKALRFNAMAMAVSAASVLLMLANKDDDDWKAREDWDRDTYWWFKVGGTAYRIPKPFELGAIGSLAERGVEAMMNGLGPDDQKLFAQRLGWMLMNTFAFNPVPQLVKPVVDLYANTDSFTGRPIESAGMERLSKSERIGPNTSMLAQILGKAGDYTGLSPVQIDSLIDGYFSWIGANALWMSDFILRPAMGAPEKASWRMEDYPVLGSFARELPAPQSRYVSLFYENADRFGQLAADIQHYQKLGLTEKAMELYEERKDEVGLAKMYEHVKRQLGAINQQIRRVQSSDLPGDEKREQIDRLNERKNELARLVEERRAARQ